MTVIYARTSIPKGRYNRPDIIKVRAKYLPCGAPCGVINIKNAPMLKKGGFNPPMPELDLSTNFMKFVPKGETQELGIKTNSKWRVV